MKFRVRFDNGSETELVAKGDTIAQAMLELLTALTSGLLRHEVFLRGDVLEVEFLEMEEEDDE